MSESSIEVLKKDIQRAKRIAAEKAMELHDLVEDQLPKAFKRLPLVSKECYDACQLWADLTEELKVLEREAGSQD